MRRPTTAALLFLLVVGGYALLGLATVSVASGATPGDAAALPVSFPGFGDAGTLLALALPVARRR